MAEPNRIVSNVYPYLRILVQVRSWQHETLAFIDTGFDGALAVPSSVVELLGRPDTSTDWEQADGSAAEAPTYSGSAEVLGLLPLSNVGVVALGNEYILGREILDLFEVTFDHGQRVIVRP